MSRLATLRLWHPGCWTLAATEEIGGLELVATNISSTPTEVVADIQAIGDDHVMGSFLGWIDGASQIEHRRVLDFSSSKSLLRVLIIYTARNSIFSTLVSHGVWPVEPIRIRDGYEYWTVCAPTKEAIADLLEDPSLQGCELKVVSLRDLSSLKKRSKKEDEGVLTQRQTDVVLQALQMGYYSWPRKISAKELAEELGLSAPTVLEHLRKSEGKIVRSFFLKGKDGQAHN